VPHGDRFYYRERPRIAIPKNQLVDLDGYWGLHPRLAPLLPMWKNGSLALVPAIGSPDSTRSHFDAQDYMESGTPGIKATRDGWLNRACQHDQEHAATPFRAVAFGPQLPRILAGSAPALAIEDLRAFGIRERGDTGLTRVFEQLYGGSSTGLLASSSKEGFEAVRMLRAADPARRGPANGAEYPRGKFGDSLRQITQLIQADLGMQIAFADMSGWDTHVNQGADQGQLALRLWHRDDGPGRQCRRRKGVRRLEGTRPDGPVRGTRRAGDDRFPNALWRGADRTVGGEGSGGGVSGVLGCREGWSDGVRGKAEQQGSGG
jgi:uncharacterized protein (DUF1501 family)